MKYLKRFENENKKDIYWIIPIEKYKMEAALRKIGVPDIIIKDWTERVSTEFKQHDIDNGKVYIFDNYKDGWIWESLSYDFFEYYSVFKGEIIPTEKEIQDEKIREKSDKYNL